ncbi:MAG: APC family permease [Nocardioidaceae bacterium]
MAGSGLLLGLVIAAGVAYCNAVASAQLASPMSGGTYVFGRERLGPWWGFTAGWGFVVGKVASCAAMALTFAAYAVPGPQWAQRAVGVAAVLLLAALNYRGIAKTALVTRLLVAISLAALAAVVVAVWTSGPQHSASLDPAGWLHTGGIHGVLQASGLIFFAFAGYARIATLGRRSGTRSTPSRERSARARHHRRGVRRSGTQRPGGDGTGRAWPSHRAAHRRRARRRCRRAGTRRPHRWCRRLLGTLLALVAGIGRTSLAMARNRDLPGWLAAVHPHYRTPHHAEAAIAVVVSVLV